MEELLPYVQAAIAECRRLQMDSRPPLLDDVGLLPTLRWFCREFQATYPGIRLQAQINIQDDSFSADQRVQLYRVLQEAMNNVGRDSRAENAEVLLNSNGDLLELTVRDDGNGFDLEDALRAGGTGLHSMRERATLTGGSFHVDSAPGKGTVVRATCPLRPSPPIGPGRKPPLGS